MIIMTNKEEFGADKYDELYSSIQSYGLDCDVNDRYKTLYEVMLKMIGKIPKILDVGCGSGQFAKMAIDMGYNYIKGIDFSEVAIKIARMRCHDTNFEHHDIRTFDYSKEDFDIAVFCEILEHIEDDIGALQRIPDDKNIILSVPDFESETHLRYFDSIDQVVERYGDVMNMSIGSVIEIPRARFFVILGGRKCES